MSGFFLPVFTLWKREIVRFFRQGSRVFSALSTPLAFWLLLGSGFRASFQPPGAPDGTTYLEYLYPGIIVLVILFTAIFSTISVIEDRKAGFLQGVLVAPVSRASIVMGQALGGATLALVQGMLFLFLAPVAGVSLSIAAIVGVIGVMTLVAFALTSVGLTIAWRMQSIQGFHAVMNLILMPIWFLSGAFFPAAGLPLWLAWLMRLNPLTYGMAALRNCFYWGNPAVVGQLPSIFPALLITTIFAGGSFLLATATARRKTE